MIKIFKPILFLLTLMILTYAEGNAQPLNQKDEAGKKHGIWVKSKPGGGVEYRGEFNHGTPVNEFLYYYPDGSLKARLDHKKGGEAYAESFYPDGETLMAEGKYLHQKREGLWKFYDENGSLQVEEYYTKGFREGASKTYYDDGSVAEVVHYSNDIKNGSWIQYHRNGNIHQEAFVVDGIKYEGEFNQFYENGKKLVTGKYENGEKEGSWIYYLENGAIETILSYTNGKLISEHPQNGTFTNYYFDDIPKDEYTYKNGKKHGPFREWYHQGEWVKEVLPEGTQPGMPERVVEKLINLQIKVEGNYKDGELHGEIIHYSPKGKVEKKEQYENGILLP